MPTPPPIPPPRCSVIVPFWNARKYVQRCIESLLCQSLPQSEYELLFIDNNSTDGCDQVVAAFPAVRLLREAKQGSYAARNRGLAAARGEILVFTDPDCAVDRCWLERIQEAMSNPAVGLTLGYRSTAGENPWLSLIAEYESQKAAFVADSRIAELKFGYTNNLAVRRHILEQVGPFEEVSRGGDTVFVRRAVDAFGISILRYCPEVQVCHLEITNLRGYYRKYATYGRTNEDVSTMTQFRPLSNHERWQVFRNTVTVLGGSAFRGAALFCLLIPGVLLYEWERFRCRTETLVTKGIRTAAVTAKNLVRLARIRDWYRSKLPFAIATALLLVPAVDLATLVAVTASIAAWGAFGFGLNEIADYPSDLRAGKQNRSEGLTPASQGLFLALTGGAALGLSLLWAADFWAPVIVLAGFGLAAAYSLRPFRLKERGLLGVIAGAAAQWSFPVLAIAAAEPAGWQRSEDLAFACTGFFLGVRWMNIHQLGDELWDTVSGVRTFANLGGPVAKLSSAAFAAEVGFLLATLMLAWPHSMTAAAALALWVVSGILPMRRKLTFRQRLLSYHDAPLAGYYFLALPLTLAMSAVPVGRTFPLAVWFCPALAVAVARSVIIFGRRQSLGGPDGVKTDSLWAVQPRLLEGTGLESAKEAALAWISTRQTRAGGYDVLVSTDPKLSSAMEVRCVFETATVARLLQPWASREDIAKTLRRCQDFLRSEREPSGLWRYFGRGSVIAADVDDTACCLLALPPDSSESGILARILFNREADGPVRTWFLDRGDDPPYRNGVDPAVNANLYMLLRQRGVDAPAILGFLQEYLFQRQFLNGTTYYASPFYFLYAFSRVADHLRPEVVKRIASEVLDLLTSRREAGVLEIAQACSALASCGAPSTVLRPLLQRILAAQLSDGGWSPEPLAWAMNRARYYYGSRAVTTAFCLEALSAAQEPPP